MSRGGTSEGIHRLRLCARTHVSTEAVAPGDIGQNLLPQWFAYNAATRRRFAGALSVRFRVTDSTSLGYFAAIRINVRAAPVG